MTPTFINSSSSSFHGGSNGDHDQHQFLGPNYHQAASSSSYSCHFHFNPTQDQTGYYNNHSELYQPQQQLEGNNYAAYGGSYELSQENKSSKLHGDQADKNPSKWMSSKMRLIQKMKNTDIKSVKITSNATIKREYQKQPSSSMEIDCSSNSSSNNSNTPIRVCADCNTTKTPLWRSGPKGPKSLCNACGIRQRKARRAMAAAAAAANDSTTLPTETPTVKIKVHHKEKTKNIGLSSTVAFKKRCKVTAGSSQEPKKLGSFEDYLINLSKNLAFHRVFPQDEKEAAILLMALSCGLVHG